MGANSPAMAFIAENMTFTSDIDKIISDNEAKFQYFKSILEMVVSAGQNDYAVRASAVGGGADPGVQQQDFTTSIMTSLGSHKSAGLPPVLPRSDGGARLISPEEIPPKSTAQ